MKKSIFVISTLLICIVGQIFGKDNPRYVLVNGYDIYNPQGDLADYNDTLFFAIDGDSIGRAENPNTIYLLQRNCLYPLGKQIENYDYHLQIMGEAGEGYLPEIVGSVKSDGTYGLDFIKAYNDLTLKNVYINGALPSSYQHWQIEMRGNGQGNTLTMDNVAIVYDRAASICVRGDSLTLDIKNSVFGNTGSNNAGNGNGRMIDIRPEAPYVKSITVENCITFNNSDRILRHMAGEIAYLNIHHLTALNSLGMNGALQLGNVREAHITNNIFANTLCLGAQTSRASEQQQADGEFAVITLDTNYVDQGQIIDIRNNNIYWDDVIKNQAWALYSDVSQPNYICATTTEALGDAADKAYFTEPLTFGNVSSVQDLAVWVASYHADPNSESLPDSWTIPGTDGNGGLYYDEFDVTYSASSKSATAGTDGAAIGCSLLDFERGTSVGSNTQQHLTEFLTALSPNPISTHGTLSFTLNNPSDVNISLYNLNGKRYKTLLNKTLSEGSHSLNIDASIIESGLYIYQVKADNKVSVGKVVIK